MWSSPSFDIAVFEFLRFFAGKYFILNAAGIFAAKYLPYVLVASAVFFIFQEPSWKKRAFIFTFLALNVTVARGIIAEIIRFAYERSRPFVALNFQPLINVDPTNAFPSGHATAFFALALALWYFNRQWGWWFLSAALINGLARVFVGVHWPTDIIGGFFVALVTFLLVKLALKHILQNKFSETEKPLS